MSGAVTLPGAVPAHIAQNPGANLNDNAAANWSGGFPTLSIRGRAWRVRAHGETELLTASPGIDPRTNQPRPEVPVGAVDVVIVGISPAISKTYYLKGFVDGEDQAPDCFSIDGVKPDAGAKVKQSPSCAACPHDRFGTATGENTRGKACRDYRRIAVVPAGDEACEGYGAPLMLRLPPTSIPLLIRYTAELKRLGHDVSQVITTLSFDYDITHPVVVFKAAGWVDDPAAYDLVLEHTRSDQVHRMLEIEMGEVLEEVAHTPPLTAALAASPPPAHVAPPAAPAAVQQAPAPVPAPVAAPAPAPTQAVVKRGAFGRVQHAPAPAPVEAKTNGAAAPASAPNPAVTVVQGAPPDMEDAIDALLK